MNPFEMVLGIVIVTGVVSVVRAKYGYSRHRSRHGYDAPDIAMQAEKDQLKQEVRAMKERLAVLERIATEDTEAKRIDREIEKLRDRN